MRRQAQRKPVKRRRNTIPGTGRKTGARLSRRQQEAKFRGLAAINRVRRGESKSLSHAARAEGTSVRAVRRLLPAALLQDRPGGRIRVKAGDPYSAPVEIVTDLGAVVVNARGSRERELAGRHRSVLIRVLRGEPPPSALEEFRGKKVGGQELQPQQDCTLIAPFSKRSEEWVTRPYTEIHSGETVNLFGEYEGKKLLPQTLPGVLWRHYLHAEDKSLSPDGERCGPYTSGLLLRRPIQAMLPFRFIGKEIERKAQEGEDIAIVEGSGPIRYQAHQTAKTRAGDPGLILRAKRFSKRRLMLESGVSQHALDRFLQAERVHPSTRARLAEAVEKLEREARISPSTGSPDRALIAKSAKRKDVSYALVSCRKER